MSAPAYKLLNEKPKPRAIIIEKPAFSFDALLDQFVQSIDRKEKTVQGYTSKLRRFSEWLNDNHIQRPSRADIKAYREYLKATELTPNTQAQYLRAVIQCFKWAAAEGLYKPIADNIHNLKIRNDRHKKDALSEAEIAKIQACIERDTLAGKRLYAIFELAVNCGLRTIEISRADVCDLKITGGNHWLYIQGKGRDDKDAKVFLVPEVYAAIKDYQDARTDKPTAKSPLFVSTSNRSNGKRLSTRTISGLLKDALKAAGFDSDRLTAHSLRHTSATTAHNSGLSLYEVQQAQRHASPATTEIYIHEQNSDLLEIKTRTAIYDQLHGKGENTDKRNRAIELLQGIDGAALDNAIAYLSALAAE